jgi:aryl sulfotransferase
MNLLQISAPKSGSYWLYTILNQIMEKKGIAAGSFIQQQPIYKEAKSWKLSFEEQAGVDMMDIEEDGCYYRISAAFREPIPEIQAYVASCRQAWTHSTLCSTSFDALPLFDKRVYIIRDPRDRALSAARFAFTPYMQQYYPCPYASPEAYLENEYEKLLEQWVWHVGNYLRQQKQLDIHFVFYERLLLDFENELKSLLAYLDLSLTAKEQQEIASVVSFSSMKASSPGHLQKGKYGKWADKLSDSQKETALEIAGPLLEMLHYPLRINQEEVQLPSLPAAGERAALKPMLEQIQWQHLFV